MYQQLHLGVQVRLTCYAAAEPARTAARAAFARIAELEQIASDYRPTSELRRLGAAAGGPAVPVSADLFHLLTLSHEVASLSDGAFDITVGPAVACWRDARRTGKFPPADRLAAARALVGHRHVVLDPVTRTARLARGGMLLDLGGIAKGYALDAALAVLREHGVTRAMVEAGGDLVVGEPPPGAAGWVVALPHLRPPDPTTVTLVNEAISTSGDTAQFVVIDGVRYSHLVDPRTGVGLTSRTIATAIAPRAATTDALATAACVLGPTAGTALLERVPGARGWVRAVAE